MKTNVNKNSIFWIKLGFAISLILVVEIGIAQISLPKIFNHNMVLQRGDSTRLWGWSETNDSIEVEFLSNNYITKPVDGKWKILLKNLPSGGPHNMSIRNGRDTLLLRNILIGDVWVCSGQSNMEMMVKECKDSLDWLGADDAISEQAIMGPHNKIPDLIKPTFYVDPSCYLPPICNPCLTPSTAEDMVTGTEDISVAELLEEEETELIIYPNPAKNAVNIFYRIHQEQYISIHLYNIEGALIGILLDNIKKESGLWSLVVDRDQLASGSYIISMRTEKEILSKQLLFLQ